MESIKNALKGAVSWCWRNRGRIAFWGSVTASTAVAVTTGVTVMGPIAGMTVMGGVGACALTGAVIWADAFILSELVTDPVNLVASVGCLAVVVGTLGGIVLLPFTLEGAMVAWSLAGIGLGAMVTVLLLGFIYDRGMLWFRSWNRRRKAEKVRETVSPADVNVVGAAAA